MPRPAPYRDRSPHLQAAAALSAVLFAVLLASCSPHHHRASLSGIHKIRHVIIIMQENRSFLVSGDQRNTPSRSSWILGGG